MGWFFVTGIIYFNCNEVMSTESANDWFEIISSTIYGMQKLNIVSC